MTKEQELREKLNELSRKTQLLLDTIYSIDFAIKDDYPEEWAIISRINDDVDPETFLGDDFDGEE